MTLTLSVTREHCKALFWSSQPSVLAGSTLQQRKLNSAVESQNIQRLELNHQQRIPSSPNKSQTILANFGQPTMNCSWSLPVWVVCSWHDWSQGWLSWFRHYLCEFVPTVSHRISKSSKPTAQWFGAPGWLASGPTSRVHRMREIHKPHLKTTKTKKIQRKIDLWTRTNAQYNGPWGLAGSVLHVARWNVQRCLQRYLNM